MRKLVRPTTKADVAFDTAIATIREKAKRATFATAAPIVKARCDTFDVMATDLSFENARSTDFDVAGLTGTAMSDLYDAQFTKNAGVREIRDGIRNAAPNGLCPYCGKGSVAQLDHYLPKKQFAGTTVHPANLVPSCADCNSVKSDYKPGPSDPPVLHPYFDTVFDFRWLYATLTRSALGLPRIDFQVQLSAPDPSLEARLHAHMKTFDLWERFSLWAGQTMSDYGQYLTGEQGSNLGREEVRKDLLSMAEKLSGDRTNSWERAAHEAMAESEWYLAVHLGRS